MKVQYITPYNQKNIHFKVRLKEEDLKCNSYCDFRREGLPLLLNQVVLGENFARPIRFVGVSNDFDSYFDIYSTGNLHLLLMPNETDVNNFAKYYNRNKRSTLNAIDRVREIVKSATVDEDLYIFESGSSNQQKIFNTKGIIPAHLHFVTNDADGAITIDILHDAFVNLIKTELKKIKNVSMDDLYSIISDLTQKGALGYKFVAKEVGDGKFDASLFIEHDPQAQTISQVIPRVLAMVFHQSNNPSYYDWKRLDTDPTMWDKIVRERVLKNRRVNSAFLIAARKLGFLA
ncbi:MAG: hypothetical protein PHC64_07645 [Candidatus Gastranaerophilales bacterium]|nr:hypothetical protein [Candidatus Gastranaerophilales bacterium]